MPVGAPRHKAVGGFLLGASQHWGQRAVRTEAGQSAASWAAPLAPCRKLIPSQARLSNSIVRQGSFSGEWG